VELYFHSPNTPSWHGAQLKHRDNLTFTLYICWHTTGVEVMGSSFSFASACSFREMQPQCRIDICTGSELCLLTVVATVDGTKLQGHTVYIP